MTLSSSETTLVTDSPSIDRGCSQIILHDDDNDSDVLDIEEYCPNREVVNLENAAVNIDNSNDVIIGPVTQFNVNGNVTIVSNGQSPTETLNGTVIDQSQTKQRFNLTNGAKLGKCEKTESEEPDLKNLNTHKKVIRIFLLISFLLLITIGVIILILHYTNHAFNDSSSYTPTTEPGSSNDDNIGNHQVIGRDQWGGREPKYYTNITAPVPLVIIKHTGGGNCFKFQECAPKVFNIQSQGFTDGLPDIKYNFLIGGDANIYVGRGWDMQPAQLNDTIDIAFIGTYSIDVLTEEMIDAAQLLLEYGVENGKLVKDYKLIAHSQTMNTQSPGENVLKEIVKWPHYDDQGCDKTIFTWQDTPLRRKLTSFNKKYLILSVVLISVLVVSAIVGYVVSFNLNRNSEEEETDTEYGNSLGDHRVYYKRDWGGRPARAVVPLAHPMRFVIISHSATPTCESFQSCSSRVRNFQDTHLSHQNNDIGYNFVVGGDADVYVGRGWDVRNFHNNVSIGICFIGNFVVDELNDGMIAVAKLLINQGVELKKLSEEYILIGHNQSSPSVPLSPGTNVYKIIKHWPHFSNKTYFYSN